MLKKKLGTEAIERGWFCSEKLGNYFKIASTLIIPESVKEIGQYAFWCCDKLKEVEIPKSVEVIGYCSFYGCRQATIILKKYKKDFKYIGSYAFSGVKDVKKEIRN